MSRSRFVATLPTILLVVLVLIAAWLRLWRIAEIPPGFHFDEAFEGLEAWRILTDSSYRPIFLMGNFGVPPINTYANALMFWAFRLFGGVEGPTAMRTTAALFGVLGVLSVYAVGRELVALDRPRTQLSRWLPLLAAASLAVMRWHVHFSRMGIEPVIVPVVWAASLWLLLLGWRTGHWLAYMAAGVIIASSIYVYQGAWIIPILAAASIVLLYVADWRKRQEDPARWMRRFFGVAVAGLTSLLLVVPLGFFFARHPDLLLLRPAQLSIVGETASPSDSSLWYNVLATMKMFVPLDGMGDMDPRRNLPGAPVLSVWQTAPFIVGLVVAAWRIRRPAYSIALVGLIGLLLPGVISEYAPHFHRILGAAAPVALLCGIGLDWLWQKTNALINGRRADGHAPWTTVLAPLVVTVLLAGAVFTTIHDYFGRWAALPDLYYAFDEGIWDIGQRTIELATDSPVYLSPRSAEHATIAFAWRIRLAEPDSLPVSYDGRRILPMTDGHNHAAEYYAVIEHEDWRTPLLLPEVLPDTEVVETLHDLSGNVYATIKERPAGTLPYFEPGTTVEAVIGDGIQLLGYDLLPEYVGPGESLYVRYTWIVADQPQRDWTVYTHLIDPRTGDIVAGTDGPPGGGSLTTTRWRSGWRVIDEYELVLPEELPAGEYTLRVGLYDDNGTLASDGDGLELGTVVIE